MSALARFLPFHSGTVSKVQKVTSTAPSLLELMSISKPAVEQYLTVLELFSDLWSGLTMDPAGTNQMVVTFFNRSFLEGLKLWVGVRALAAHLMFAPHLPLRTMPRCWRCFEGWTRLSAHYLDTTASVCNMVRARVPTVGFTIECQKFFAFCAQTLCGQVFKGCNAGLGACILQIDVTFAARLFHSSVESH